jgi:hypothetical protein
MSGSSGIGRLSQRVTGRIFDGICGYSTDHFFHFCYPLLNRWHHTEVAVCEVIRQLPPHHGDCKQHGTFFVICDEQRVQDMYGAQRLSWSPAYFTTKVLQVDSFYDWV